MADIKAYLQFVRKHSFTPQCKNAYMDDYGQRVEKALKFRHKTRNDLSGAIGVTVQAIGQVIRGESKMFDARAHTLACEYLEIDPLWLINGDGIMDYDTATRHGTRVLRAMQPEKRYEAVRVFIRLLNRR